MTNQQILAYHATSAWVHLSSMCEVIKLESLSLASQATLHEAIVLTDALARQYAEADGDKYGHNKN